LSKNKYFQYTQKIKILDEKCLFIAIYFYLFIAILHCAQKMSSVYKPLQFKEAQSDRQFSHPFEESHFFKGRETGKYNQLRMAKL